MPRVTAGWPIRACLCPEGLAWCLAWAEHWGSPWRVGCIGGSRWGAGERAGPPAGLGEEQGCPRRSARRQARPRPRPLTWVSPQTPLLGTFWSSERRVTGNLRLEGQLGESGPSQ